MATKPVKCPSCKMTLQHLKDGIRVCNNLNCKKTGTLYKLNTLSELELFVSDVPIYYNNQLIYLPNEWKLKQSIKPDECGCGSTEFWFKGQWNCIRCHPIPSEVNNSDRIEAKNKISSREEISRAIEDQIEYARKRGTQ